MTRFDPKQVTAEQLVQMFRFVNLKQLRTQLDIAREENPSLFFGMVKLIRRGTKRRDRKYWNAASVS